MTAYIIVDVAIHDTEKQMEYVELAPSFVRKHQGKYLVRGGEVEVEEGTRRLKGYVRLILATVVKLSPLLVKTNRFM